MEHEAEVNMQKMDNVMAQKEMADLKKFDEEYVRPLPLPVHGQFFKC